MILLKPARLAAILSAAFFCRSVSGGADTTPPALTSLHFNPTSINTSLGATEVTITFSAAGSGSGVTYFEAGFSDASGTSRQSASLKFDPARSVTKAVHLTFPRFSNSGTWTLTNIFLGDAAGNTLILDTGELSERGYATRLEVTSVKDIASPKLTAVDFTPTEIDTSTGAVSVKVNLTATDDLSGVSHVEIGIASPSGSGRIGQTLKIQPARSSTVKMTVTFPQFSEPGQWALSQVFLADAAGNTLVLNADDLANLGIRTTISVRSARDTGRPQLTSLHYPRSIDTSSGPATVKVDFRATDDLSGVRFVEVTFASPSGNATRSGAAEFAPSVDVTKSLNVNFPAMSESGNWTVSTVLATDAVGNTLLLSGDDVARLGFPPLQVK